MLFDNCEIVIPDSTQDLDQDQEWIKIVTAEGSRRVRLHEYARFYEIPGLYDLFYERLECRSPEVVSGALKEQLGLAGERQDTLRVLDFGAGNGLVGHALTRDQGCAALVGLDIIPEARDAAHRDRPGVYDAYYVTDMANLREEDRRRLESWRFNTLITVAALGFGDICTKAFVNAFNLLKTGAWVAFNIKDRFMSEQDESGFHGLLNRLMRQGLDVKCTQRYRHRFSLCGEPLFYYVVVGRKIDHLHLH